MHWCFDCTNRPKCHSNYFICLRSVIWIGLDMGRHFVIIVDWVGLGHRVDGLDWIGFRNWTHVRPLQPNHHPLVTGLTLSVQIHDLTVCL